MTEEFNLSEKIELESFNNIITTVVKAEDVKEFMKRLKEKIIFHNKIGRNEVHWINREIDKLAGDNLR